MHKHGCNGVYVEDFLYSLTDIWYLLNFFLYILSHIFLKYDKLFKKLWFPFFSMDGLTHNLKSIYTACQVEWTKVVPAHTIYTNKAFLQN